ncbi:hypothetical protein C8J57DRAFT_670513 [Mycena rebaudengoi]|nr:hypothetical protein C8J57DRAFT_670513 [Mycena rebaudengoi]
MVIRTVDSSSPPPSPVPRRTCTLWAAVAVLWGRAVHDGGERASFFLLPSSFWGLWIWFLGFLERAAFRVWPIFYRGFYTPSCVLFLANLCAKHVFLRGSLIRALFNLI